MTRYTVPGTNNRILVTPTAGSTNAVFGHQNGNAGVFLMGGNWRSPSSYGAGSVFNTASFSSLRWIAFCVTSNTSAPLIVNGIDVRLLERPPIVTRCLAILDTSRAPAANSSSACLFLASLLQVANRVATSPVATVPTSLSINTNQQPGQWGAAEARARRVAVREPLSSLPTPPFPFLTLLSAPRATSFRFRCSCGTEPLVSTTCTRWCETVACPCSVHMRML